MHIEASWFTKGSVAILESPYMMPASNCKMTFYYHMFGGDCGSLLVYINSGDSIQLVFNQTGDHGDQWIGATVPLKSGYGFRIHITATRGNSFKGDIAIDDIKFQVQLYRDLAYNLFALNLNSATLYQLAEGLNLLFVPATKIIQAIWIYF